MKIDPLVLVFVALLLAIGLFAYSYTQKQNQKQTLPVVPLTPAVQNPAVSISPSNSATPANQPPRPVCACLNEGFDDLGLKGTIDGPFTIGDGTYSVNKNECSKLSIIIKTGFIDALLGLSRDSNCHDTISLNGQVKSGIGGDWISQNSNLDAVISYDKIKDEGLILYTDSVGSHSDKFRDGKDNENEMDIDLSGYSHTFISES